MLGLRGVNGFAAGFKVNVFFGGALTEPSALTVPEPVSITAF